MKANMEMDAGSGLVYEVRSVPASELGAEQVQDLLHGSERVVYAETS